MGESELVSHITFEQFCRLNGILAEPIQRTAAPTPDYRVSVGPKCYFVELKQLELTKTISGSSDSWRRRGRQPGKWPPGSEHGTRSIRRHVN
jgi:hypothetical protein